MKITEEEKRINVLYYYKTYEHSIDIIHNFPSKVILLYLIIFHYILYYSLQNFICRHIYQYFIVTTHYYIVFYNFNNS